jgi:predicted dinucleotide-binding enzyme
MRIAVIGAGNIGATLARKWSAAGHAVVFGVRDPSAEKPRALASELGGSVAVPSEAAQGADVVVLAIPGAVVDETMAVIGEGAATGVVIDAANNIGADPPNNLASVRRHAPGAGYVRAFNTLGWENFEQPAIDGVILDLFFAGDEGRASSVAEELIADVGLRPVRLGGEDAVGLVDALLRVWFALVTGGGRSRHLGLKMLED